MVQETLEQRWERLCGLEKENSNLKKQLAEIKTGDQYLFRGHPLAYWEELEVHAKEMDYIKFVEEILDLKQRVEELGIIIEEGKCIAFNRNPDRVEPTGELCEEITVLYRAWKARAEKAEANLARLKEAVESHRIIYNGIGKTSMADRQLYYVLDEMKEGE